jgi:O-antigen ligase
MISPSAHNSINFSALAILSSIFVTIVVFPPLMDPINTPKLWILTLSAGVTAFLTLRNSYKKNTLKIEKKVLFLIIIFLILAFFSSIVNKQNLYTSSIGAFGRNNGLISIVAFSLLFLVMSSSSNIATAKFLLLNLTVLGFFNCTYAWLQYYKMDFLSSLFPSYNPNSQPELAGVIVLTVGNSNFASVLLGLTFTASVGYFLNSKNFKLLRLLAFLSSFFHWLLIPHLDMQGRIIFTAGGLIVFGIWLSTSSNNVLKKLSYGYWMISFLIGCIGFSALFGIGPYAERLSNDLVNLKDRYYHWLTAINMLQDNLLSGVGIDAFGNYYHRYRVAESIQYRGTPMGGTNNAHNIFLQYGATGGLALMVVYLLITLLIFWRGVLAIKNNPSERLVIGSLFALWICYQIQSAVSIEQIGITVWNWVIGGALIGLSLKESSENKNDMTRDLLIKNKSYSLQKSLFVILMVYSLTASILVVSTLVNDRQIFTKFQALNIATSKEQAQKNVNDVVLLALASNHPKLRMTIINSIGRAGWTNEAFKLAEQTTIDFPDFLDAWDITASILEASNQKQQAVPFRIKSLEIDPLNQIFKEKLIQDKTS